MFRLNRRTLLQSAGVAAGTLAVTPPAEATLPGKFTGAQAVVAALQAEGTCLVFGIPGAQGNELWDEFKSAGLPYLLVTHEYSASTMADGYARATGRPGVLCVVPGPGVTNALTGLGEALLDSVPLVAIVGDVARGPHAHPFQVHCLDQVALLQPVCKGVFNVQHAAQIPDTIRQAFALAVCGEPGPTAVVIPYPFLIETLPAGLSPRLPPVLPFDEPAARRALGLLADRRLRVGIYAGQGCLDCADLVTATAELLQAPVATSVSGKGAIDERHSLAVGWGYGPQGTATAEEIFQPKLVGGIDLVLAVGVKYSEVSTGFYSNPQSKHIIHVDANACNLGKILRTDVGVHADARLFLSFLLGQSECLRRPPEPALAQRIRTLKHEEANAHATAHAACGVHPLALVRAMRCAVPEDGLLYVDVTVSEHLAAEAFTTMRPRTYFNPTDNQAMGWSIPAALGGQAACPGRIVATLTGDGCFLMSALELATAARVGLPVKFFILDDRAYHYMEMLQLQAYKRTTATHLPSFNYAAFAQAVGVSYREIVNEVNLTEQVRAALSQPGPVLVRVGVNYAGLKIRWLDAVKHRFTEELSAGQKLRFLARLGKRSLHGAGPSD